MQKITEDDLGIEVSSEAEAITTESSANDTENIVEGSFNQDQVYNLAKNDLDFLASMAQPESITYDFPPVFLSVWLWLLSYVHLSRDFSKLALGLPRGFGKTTLIKIFILYCILFTKKKFILVIASNATLATNIIADVEDMLDEPNIKRTFGDWRLGLEKDTQILKKFGFKGRDIILAGIGQGGSLRGLNIKNRRPDVMIFEDVQTREDADSQSTSEAIERWMVGTAMKSKSYAGCLYIFVANMYPTKWSILRKLKQNASWTKFIAGGILADGTSLWEELQPVKQLLEEFEGDLNSGHPEIFYSEVLNDENANVNTFIDIGKIPAYPYQPEDINTGHFIIIDPSNDKVNSDAVTISYNVVMDGIPVCREIIDGKFSPSDTIREALDICFRTGCQLIAVESNAYQYSLLYWFGFICQQMGVIGIEAVPVYSGQLAKTTRILNMFKELTGEHPTIIIHPDARPLVFNQIVQYNPSKRNNVDGILDCLTYIPVVIATYGEYIYSQSALNFQELGAIRVHSVEDNSTF